MVVNTQNEIMIRMGSDVQIAPEFVISVSASCKYGGCFQKGVAGPSLLTVYFRSTSDVNCTE